MKGYRRLLLISGFLAALVVLCAKCMYFQKKETVPATAIAGSETCRKCHATIYDMYLKNAHHETSHPLTSTDITAGHPADTNTFTFNDRLKVVIEKRDEVMYQVAYLDGKETISRRFDIAIGSGKKAFTYGYWEGKKLKQLPLSFYSVINQWANSPGFPSTLVYYERPIGSRCLECHTAFVDRKVIKTSGISVDEELDRKSLIYGIDCERCHGPAGRHVQLHLDSPTVKKAQYITLYRNLSRKQKVDACAVCHSGNDVEQKKSTFAFKPGDNLDDFYDPSAGTFGAGNADVHGNHSQLMKSSKCYIKSNSMTCNSCHNVHEDLKGSLAIYSQRCMNCHQTVQHSKATLAKGVLKSNCIDCHMPNQPSKLISFQTAQSGKISSYMLRTHHIAIYPDKAVN